MGMFDQRGQRRRVVCDGQPQAQEQAPDERGLVGEQRGIRLLPDSGAGRGPARTATAFGRPTPTALGTDQGPGSESEPEPEPEPEPNPESDPSPTADPGHVERTRRIRCDETHA